MTQCHTRNLGATHKRYFCNENCAEKDLIITDLGHRLDTKTNKIVVLEPSSASEGNNQQERMSWLWCPTNLKYYKQ